MYYFSEKKNFLVSLHKSRVFAYTHIFDMSCVIYLCTGCPRKDLSKRKLYISVNSQPNLIIFFCLIEKSFKFYFIKKVHKYCSNVSPFTSIQNFNLLTILSKTVINVSFLIDLFCSSIRFFKSSISLTCVL